MAIESGFKLNDRNALLSGPVSSVNQSIARKLTELGCNVALLDRNVEKASRFADQLNSAREINEKFGRAVAIQADLSKPHHVSTSISKAAEAFGGLDIYIDGLMTTEVLRFSEPQIIEELDRLIDVNLKAAVMTAHSVFKYLEGRRRGRMIFLTQALAAKGLEGNSLLAVTRGGLVDFARTLAKEVSSAQFTVNVVSLGASEEFLLAQASPSGVTGARGTGAPGAAGAEKAQPGADRAAALTTQQQQVQRQVQSQREQTGSINSSLESLRAKFPSAQILDSERAANVVAFLASPLGLGVNGQVLEVV